MNKFLKSLIIPSIMGGVAAFLVFMDSLMAPLFVSGAAFAWMGFINWTVFAVASDKDRIKGLVGLVLGYFGANLMIIIGNSLSDILPIKLINASLPVLIGVFVVNVIIISLDKKKLDKFYLNSISGMFAGVSFTFSGAGVGLNSSDLKLLFIIIAYGLLGLACGYIGNRLTKRFREQD